MTAEKTKVPFVIRDLDKEDNELLKKLFSGEPDGYVRAGPKGYLFKSNYKNLAADYYNLEIKPDDTFIVTYPRSGTTWTQELIWLVANDNDFEKAKTIPLIERFPYLDMNGLLSHASYKEFVELNKHDSMKLAIVEHCNKRTEELVGGLASPRFIKTHLPMSLLPPHLLDTAKVVFVARDPRDVAVSYYHLHRLFKPDGYEGDFKTYWNLFMKNLIRQGRVEKRNHPNMLFLFYEDLTKDLSKAIQRVSDFFNKKLSEEQVKNLCDHLNIENFKKNPSVNMDPLKQAGMFNEREETFIRKGKSGGWRSYFDDEMTQQAEKWIAENLRDTDLRFPVM